MCKQNSSLTKQNLDNGLFTQVRFLNINFQCILSTQLKIFTKVNLEGIVF